jgi:hypothetical protein
MNPRIDLDLNRALRSIGVNPKTSVFIPAPGYIGDVSPHVEAALKEPAMRIGTRIGTTKTTKT